MLIRYVRKTSKKIHYFTKRLGNKKIEVFNTGFISNIILILSIIKPLNLMSIKITKHKYSQVDVKKEDYFYTIRNYI